MTQRDNSGTHRWSEASLRDLVPPVAVEAAADQGTERQSSTVDADPMPLVVTADLAGDDADAEAATGAPVDARSLDELERDLAALAERLRGASALSPDTEAAALPTVESGPVVEPEPTVEPASEVESGAVVEPQPAPDLSPADREHIAAAAARLDADRAEAKPSAGSEDAAPLDASWNPPTIDDDLVDDTSVLDPPAAAALDPAALDAAVVDVRDEASAGSVPVEEATADDEIDLRGPDGTPSGAEPGAGVLSAADVAGEATLDADARAFVHDLAARADRAAPGVSADETVFDLGAAAKAARATSRPATPPPAPADAPADGVFDLRQGDAADRPPTPAGPPLQHSTVDWEAIVTDSAGDAEPPVAEAPTDGSSAATAAEPEVAEQANIAEPVADVTGQADRTDEVEIVPVADVTGQADRTDEVEAVPVAEAGSETGAPTAGIPPEVSTVDWGAVVGDSADASESPAAADGPLDAVAPPAIASSPAHPPRIQAPDEPAASSGDAPSTPVDGPFASTLAVHDHGTLARASVLTSLCVDGLRDDDVAVLDGRAASALDDLISGFDDDVAPSLRSKTLRTDVVGESVPLAMGLSSLPVASAPNRRIFAVVDRVELEHGSSWAALDALGESSPTPPVLVVTVDPSEMRPDERPDRLIQRWARRLLDLGWRAVDLRYGRHHRHHLEQDANDTEMTVLLDAERLDDRIRAGLIDVGGNDLDDLRWFWDVVHRSRRPTVAFVYVSPPPSIPSESASSIAALADRLQNEEPSAPRVPMLGLVRFDPEVHPAADTQTAVLDALNSLVCDDAAFRTATIVVSIGRCPLEMPEGAVVVEVGEEAAAVSLARAASALGRLPIVLGPDERMAGAVLAMSPTTDSDAGDAVLIGLHSGIDAGTELGAVRSRSVPAIATATPRLEVVEPFATDWVDAQFRDALHRVDVGEGSTYLRVSRRALPASSIEDAQLGPALRRGGALLHRSLDDPAVVIVGVGHLVPTALDAAMKLESEGVHTDVVGIAIAERLREAGSDEVASAGLDRLIEAQRGHRLAVVLHDALGGLEWIGGATGLRAVSITPTGTEPPSADEVVETTKTALTR